MQKRLIAGYALIAKETRAEIAPVGHVWQQIRAKHPDLDLYAQDGSHPSKLGTHLAASVFYSTIFRTAPTNLPALNLPSDTARILHEAARSTQKFQ